MSWINQLAPALILLLLSGMGVVGWYFFTRFLEHMQKSNTNEAALSATLVNIGDKLKTLQNELEGGLADIPKLTTNVRLISQRLDHFEKQLEIALIVAGSVEKMREEVAVLKRNETSQWKRIDEMAADIDSMRALMEEFSKIIAPIRAQYGSNN